VFKRALTTLGTPFDAAAPIAIKTSPTGARLVCDEAVNMIFSFERMYRIGSDGLVHPYWDALGYPTIGVGHLLSKVVHEDLSKYPAITLDAAYSLHRQDLDKFSSGVSRLCKVAVSDKQFGALVSLAFNIGLGNLQASTLLRKLNRGDPLIDVAECFLAWNKAGGKILNGLTTRRRAEQKLFLS
jgi:lysozyme